MEEKKSSNELLLLENEYRNEICKNKGEKPTIATMSQSKLVSKVASFLNKTKQTPESKRESPTNDDSSSKPSVVMDILLLEDTQEQENDGNNH